MRYQYYLNYTTANGNKTGRAGIATAPNIGEALEKACDKARQQAGKSTIRVTSIKIEELA